MAKRKRGEDAAGCEKPSRPPTAFEERMYQLCKCIPAGKVSTYGAMAKVLKSSPRSVGQALRRNPFAPVVPCHRVVAADLNIGGFSGGWGIDNPKVQRKRAMLQAEGVPFDGCAVASPACVLGEEELRALLAGAVKAGPGAAA
ncbi:hypothetical protein HYH03_018233 [Edaphochlamys debaryana]|uniref:Methylated-DNA--protein-cysteine methyltransferase n=1 Tax=Edaphochlamys debaryana TaxID=47281 RepID=A0A836BNC4_9CHLO|nr:hypothetical protein HYH03_018233 [Edaphochlamys debaryana]|eukprot:KAG2482890.1 hypothetical protein HYH03_018233 [Edaphochlamys debaryana]